MVSVLQFFLKFLMIIGQNYHKNRRCGMMLSYKPKKYIQPCLSICFDQCNYLKFSGFQNFAKFNNFPLFLTDANNQWFSIVHLAVTELKYFYYTLYFRFSFIFSAMKLKVHHIWSLKDLNGQLHFWRDMFILKIW